MKAKNLERYRPTMHEDVLRCWAEDADEHIQTIEAEITSLKIQLAAERKRVEKLRETVVEIAQSRLYGIDYAVRIARSAIAEMREMTLDDHTQMAFGEEDV